MPKRYDITVMGGLDSSEGRITELVVPDYLAHARENGEGLRAASLSIVSKVRLHRLPDVGWFKEPGAVTLDWVETVPNSHQNRGSLPKFFLPWDADLKLGRDQVVPFEGAARKVEEVIRTRTSKPLGEFDRELIGRFLRIVREDYRSAKLLAATRNMLMYSTQPEIERLLREEVARQVMAG